MFWKLPPKERQKVNHTVISAVQQLNDAEGRAPPGTKAFLAGIIGSFMAERRELQAYWQGEKRTMDQQDVSNMRQIEISALGQSRTFAVLPYYVRLYPKSGHRA
jgi:hypothetical protein